MTLLKSSVECIEKLFLSLLYIFSGIFLLSKKIAFLFCIKNLLNQLSMTKNKWDLLFFTPYEPYENSPDFKKIIDSLNLHSTISSKPEDIFLHTSLFKIFLMLYCIPPSI